MKISDKKGIILCSIFTAIITILLTLNFLSLEEYELASNIYQVYLDGEKIGMIDSKDKLYAMINKEQIEIKEEYDVKQVYPPKGFQIIKCNTYNDQLTTIENVYNSIKDEKEFTIKGYTITIKSDEKGKEPIYIYVLDKKIFEEAIQNVIETFIGEERYQQYKENTQPEIVDVGYIIENMYFKETISIKESYVSVDEKIYTETDDLTKYLLFGENTEAKEYVVVQGDTVESIAYKNKLNTSELIIANEDLQDEDTLLAIGQKLNVALINPVLSLVYEELVVEDKEQVYTTIYEEDSTQYVGYKKVKQEGIKGISRFTSCVQFVNGEQNQGGVFIGEPQVIRAVQNEIIVKGTKKKYTSSSSGSSGVITGEFVDTGTTWGWPTNSPYLITSKYGYRWGTLHDGLDISGTGYGSPIYAALDGVVVSSQYGGLVGSSAGYNVVILHSNGYYTVYAHCSKLYAKVGQSVKRGEKIAAMGKSGVATGTHLHFGVFIGKPYNGGRSIDPLRLWN